MGLTAMSGTYKSVTGLRRGLAVLEALNDRGARSVSALSLQTGLHRTTVYRLLQTLEEAGYVRRSTDDNCYQLTLKVRTLSEGFDNEAWITETAAPLLGELFHEVLWPTSIVTYNEGVMVIRETTHRFSPFSIHHSMVGKTLPVLKTAAGRAYLAFSGDDERERALETIRRNAEPDMAQPDDAWIERLIQQTRRQGYGLNVGETDKKIVAFAVPIRWGGRIIACLNIIYFASSMSRIAALERYLPLMRKTAAAIEDVLHQRQASFVGPGLLSVIAKS